MDYCEAGVSTHLAVDHADVHPESFSLVFALVSRKELKLTPGRVYFTNRDSKFNLSASSVTPFLIHGFSKELLQCFGGSAKVPLWEVVERLSLGEDGGLPVLATLNAIAHEHATHTDAAMEQLRKAYRGRDFKEPENFRKAREVNLVFGRTIERLITTCRYSQQGSFYEAPLSEGPCLCGICDPREFHHSHDSCKRKLESFEEHLKNMCSCGRLAVPRHKDHDKKGIGSKLHEADWYAAATHNLKASAIEQLVAGKPKHSFFGSMMSSQYRRVWYPGGLVFVVCCVLFFLFLGYCMYYA